MSSVRPLCEIATFIRNDFHLRKNKFGNITLYEVSPQYSQFLLCPPFSVVLTAFCIHYKRNWIYSFTYYTSNTVLYEHQFPLRSLDSVIYNTPDARLPRVFKKCLFPFVVKIVTISFCSWTFSSFIP